VGRLQKTTLAARFLLGYEKIIESETAHSPEFRPDAGLTTSGEL